MLVLWCALAVVAVVAVLRGEWFRATPRIGPAWTLRGEPSIFGFAAAFLAAAVGASIAVTAFAPEDPAAPLRMMAGKSVLAHAAQIAVWRSSSPCRSSGRAARTRRWRAAACTSTRAVRSSRW
jgi:hypothetical protein